MTLLNLQKKKTIIFELGTLAVYVSCLSLLPPEGVFQNDGIVIFINDDAVLSRLVSGRGGSFIESSIFQGGMGEGWESNAEILEQCSVPGTANVADAPSRGDAAGLYRSFEIQFPCLKQCSALPLKQLEEKQFDSIPVAKWCERLCISQLTHECKS